MNILDKIVEEKKREVAKLPARLIAAGDLRDALLERGERRDFLAAHCNTAALAADIGSLRKSKKPRHPPA